MKRPHSFARTGSTLRGVEGIALPLVLLSLIAVTILVTSVIVSSSTEVALSSAHQDATQRLFRAEGALQAYVAQQQLALVPTGTPVRYLPPGAPATDSVTVSVAVLGTTPNPTPTFPRDTTYSITVRPIRGGREVVAMIAKENRSLTMNVQGGLISGDNVSVGGNSTVSDGSDSGTCADSVGGKAIQTTGDATVTRSGNGTIIGEVETTPTQAGGIVMDLLGTTLPSLVDRADIKFGRGAFQNATASSLRSVANPLSPQSTPLNWGCPADVYVNTNGSTACEADTDVAHLPLIAIDASNADGSFGTAVLNGSHGQGVLVVYNGNLNIQGNFAFKGLVLVEGTFDIRGSGGGAASTKLEGAVIGLGRNANGTQSTIDNNDLTGSPTLRYNRCAVQLLQTSWSTTKSFTRLGKRTFAWFEVVR